MIPLIREVKGFCSQFQRNSINSPFHSYESKVGNKFIELLEKQELSIIES